MLKYIIKRFLYCILTIWIITTVTFILMHSVPGSPFSMAGGKKIPPEVLHNLNVKYGLNKPMFDQYTLYLKNIITKGDLGQSMAENRTANEIIATRLPYSATIGTIAMVFGVVFGLILGIWSAIKSNTKVDYTIGVSTMVFISIPSYIVALLLQYFLATSLGWFSINGFNSVKDAILPSISLALPIMATITKFMRSNMVDVIGQDYIKTAKAKGISQSKVVWKHIIRNAILPVVTIVGPMFVSIITGTFLIEEIFGIPGLGQYFVNSVSNRDYTMIMATTVFFSVLIVFMNFFVDILYGIIDPRIRIS